MPVHLVATDLDGTLVRSDGTISARTLAALHAVEDAGILVVFVTGRPPRWLQPVADATGHQGLAICANGALVYDMAREEVVAENPLSAEAAREVVTALRSAVPGSVFAVERATHFAHEPAYRPRWQMTPDALVADVDELLRAPVAKLLCRHDDLLPDDLLAQARAAIGSAATVTHSSTEGLVEISAAGVSKAFALERLARERGWDSGDVLAFGDMPNDIPMLGWAGQGVAVANAHADVLAVADEVTASNDDDGVAIVLERLLSEQAAGAR